MAVLPSLGILYVADSNGVDAFTIHPNTGALTPLAGSPFGEGPNLDVVVDPAGKYVFATLPTSPSGIQAFSIGPNGALTPVTGSPFTLPEYGSNSGGPAWLVDTGSFLYVTLGSVNKLAGFSINSASGALTPLSSGVIATGNDPIFLVNSNQFLYVANTADDTISGYSFDSGTGALSIVSGSPFGSGVVFIVIDPQETHLFASELGHLVDFNINATTGALTPGVTSFQQLYPLFLTVAQLPSTITTPTDSKQIARIN